MTEIYYPPSANAGTIFLVFLALLIAVHLLMVWPRNLSKRLWKFVDYVWLAFALVGVVGASANVRMYIANKELASAEIRAANYYELFRHVLALNVKNDGYVCRTFEVDKSLAPSPDLSDIQKEFDRVCAWLKSTEETMPKKLAFNIEERVTLGQIVPMTNDLSLVEVLAGLKDQFSTYQNENDIYQKLKSEAKPTKFEIDFSFLTPWMLVLALAIRVAKVSGELRYER